MASRTLIVEIVGDSKSLERSFARSTAAAKTFETQTTGVAGRVDKSFKKIQGLRTGTALLGGTAAIASLAAINKAVDAASNLNEQITKNQQVFKDSSGAVIAWSQTTAKAIGISETAALEATGTFGNLFTAIGVSGPAAADTSKRLVQLAADLASFNNASPEDTLQALRSGLVGEVEPLRKYGVLLSEARVQQVALAATGKNSAAALTVQEKAAARVAIIFKDTASAQGDFARTSDGLANTQRRLAAQLQDTQAELGKTAAPIKNQLLHFLIAAGDATNKFAGALKDLAAVPAIHKVVTFDLTFGGGGGGFNVGDLLKGNIFDIAKLGVDAARGTGPFGTKDTFDENKAAKAFEAQFGGFVENLHKGQKKAAAKAAGKAQGFGAGLTPQDLFGPLIKGVTPAQEEALVDAQLTGNQKTIRGVLTRIQSSLTEALNDPRLKRAGRVGIKQALEGVKGQIAGIDSEVAAGVKSANDARTARLEKTKQDAADAAAKHKEQIRAIAEDLASLRETAAKEIQDRQFRNLGLDTEGNKPPPAIANLQKQLKQLSSRDDLTKNDKGLLARIRKVLVDPIDKATPETRAAIDNLFQTIRDGFDKGSKKITEGPLTKTSSLNANKILAGLGLDRDAEKQLRARLSGFNSAGLSLAGNQRPTGSFSGGRPIVIENHTTVSLDGETVGKSVTKTQQKDKRRNPRQKRGPNR